MSIGAPLLEILSDRRETSCSGLRKGDEVKMTESTSAVTIIPFANSKPPIFVICERQDISFNKIYIQEGSDKPLQSGATDGFKQLADHWIQACLGFFEAFPLIGYVAHMVQISSAEESLVKYVEGNCRDKETSVDDKSKTETVKYSIDSHHAYKIISVIKQLNQFKRAERSLERALLLSVIAEYEAFFAKILRATASIQPEIFFAKDATVSAIDVMKSDSIDSIKDMLIEDSIDSLMRESHSEQIKYIFEKLKLTPPSGELMKEFGEVCERRNVLTHADGRVNKHYVSRMRKLGYDAKDIPALGKELVIDDHYLKRSIARVFQVGYYTLHLIWQHLKKDDAKLSVQSVINHSHDFLDAGYTKMAARLCEFALNSKSPASEGDRAYATINLALSQFFDSSKSKSDRDNLVQKTLATRDWSFVNSQFSLAICCLTEDYEKLPELIDRSVADGLTVDSFLSWALFREAKKQSSFRQKMKHHFDVDMENGESGGGTANSDSLDELVQVAQGDV